jgi:hypothetical protein
VTASASATGVPAGRAGWVRAGRSLEGIQDEIEPISELVAVAVTGLEDVSGGQLGEVGVGRMKGGTAADLPPGLP